MAFDIIGAKNAGYSDTEIADYLSSQSGFDAAGARKAGYSDQEIIGHVSGSVDVGAEAPKPPRIFSTPSKGTQQDVMGIASPKDRQAAETAQVFVKNDIPAVAKTFGAKIGGGMEQSIGGAMRAYGEENTNRFNVDDNQLAQTRAGRYLNDLTAADDTQRAAIAQRGTELGNEGRAVIQAAQEDQPVQTRAGRILDQTAQSIGSNLPGMAATMMTGSPAVGLSMMGLQSFGQTYDESRAKGLNIADATMNAAIQGGTEVATEMLPFVALSKYLKTDHLSKEVLKHYLSDIPGEHLATAIQNASDAAYDTADMTPQQRVDAAADYLASNKHKEDQIDTFFTTVLQGAVMGGVAKVAKAGNALAPEAQPAAQPAPSGPLSRAVGMADTRAVAPVQSIGSLVAERRGLAQQPAQVAQPVIEQPAPEVAPAEPVVSRAAAPVQGIGGLVAERRKLAENQVNPDAQISPVAGLSEPVDISVSPISQGVVPISPTIGVSNETADEGRQDDRQYAQGTESNADGEGQGRDEAALQAVQREGTTAQGETGVTPPPKVEAPAPVERDNTAQEAIAAMREGRVFLSRDGKTFMLSAEGGGGYKPSGKLTKAPWDKSIRVQYPDFRSLYDTAKEAPSVGEEAALPAKFSLDSRDTGSLQLEPVTQGGTIGSTEKLRDLVSSPSFAEELDNLVHVPTDAPVSLHPTDRISVQTPPSKGHTEGVRGDVQFLSGLLRGKPFLEKGYSGVDVKTQGAMQAAMLRVADNNQVFDTVVKLIPVDVMDVLRREQLTPEMVFHDPAVLKHTLSANLPHDVSVTGNLADSLVKALTLAGAVVESRQASPASGDTAGQPIHGFTTSGTKDRDTRHSLVGDVASHRTKEVAADIGGDLVGLLPNRDTADGTAKGSFHNGKLPRYGEEVNPLRNDPDNLTLQRVMDVFPNQKIKEKDGVFVVTTPSGIAIRISKVGEIEFDRKAAEEAYGREILPHESPVAEFRPLDHGAVINLTEKGVNQLEHESFHAAMALSLTPRQISAVLRTFGNEEKAAAEYQRLKESGALETRKGNYWLAKIYRFLRSLRQLISPTAKGVMEDVASGKVWGKAHAGEGGARYAAQGHTDSLAFKRWSNNAPLVTAAKALAYEFKSGGKVVVEAFHGTARPDRVGNKFLKKRATSGPMSFFTSGPELASGYAQGKQDTSLANEDTDYPNWFKYKPKGSRSTVGIDRAWYFLPAEIKQKIIERMKDIRTDDDGNIIYEEGGGDIGSYEWELKQTQRGYDRVGNPLKAAVETWLMSGSLFNQEEDFMKVLELAGFPVEEIKYDPPHAAYPFVYKVYVAMQSPLVTDDIPQNVIDALHEAAKRDRTRAQRHGADMWDKNTRTLKDWVGEFDREENQYVWTSIPDKVTEVFKSLGYDGIIDVGGKGGGEKHKVYIPFEETQVKSAIGNKGTYDPTKNDIRYSLRSAFTGHNPAALKSSLTVHPKVQALVGSVFNNGRNVSPWMRTVGTMYHMAEKLAAEGKPQFKAVFDKGQEFLTDVSTLALEAESLAPDIFPKMGTGKGLFHNLPRKDAIAIAEPLYQGTLFGGADPKKGKVFSGTELKRIFNLSDHQIDLYKQARAATDQSLDDMAKALIARNAKEAQVGFDREMDLADMAAEVKSAIQDKVDTMKAALEQIEDDFKNTPPDPDAKVQKKLDKAHNRAVSTQEAAIELHESFIANVENLAYKTDLLKRRGYFPLMRFGQYTVTMKDHNGKVEFFGLYESAYKARLMTDALSKENPGMSVVQSVMGREKFKLFAGMNLEGLQLFAEHMKAEDSEAYQEYLKQAMNNRSAMKRLIHRKGTEGYSEDAVRTLANFITSNARHASTQYHLHDMRKLASEVPEDTQGDVQDQAVKLYEYLSKPAEEASKLRGYLFFHYLGGSLASGIVNMTQPVMMTMPYLASKTTAAKAAMHLTKASKMSFTDPAKVGGELGVALRRAENEGVTAPQEIYQLTAMASNKLLAANPYWNAGLKAWGGFFSVAEAFNRRVTFIASYRISREKGLSPDRAYTEAVKAITETQGIYNKGNRPKWGRGTVGGTLFTFKQFSVMYLELFNRLPAKQKGIMLGILWLMAGLQGMPFAEDAEDIIDTIGQWAGFATNSKRWLNQQAEDALGKDAGGFVTQGISSVLPLDLQGRMGLQNLVPGTGILKQSATDKGKDVKEFFGPAGGLLASLGDALTLAAQGLPGRAALAASPRAVQNIAQGVEMMATGAGHDKYGRKTVELSPGESAMKLTGFNPSRVAEEGQIKSANMQDVNLLRVRKNEISTQWAYGIAHKDSGEIAEAKRKLLDWNAKNPELKMNMGGVVQSARQKARALNTTGKERFLKSMPKEIRRRVIDELG